MRSWPRALSIEDLKIITSWHTLAEKEPDLGQCCLYRIVTDLWSGETETGVWGDIPDWVNGITVVYTRQRTFIDGRGWLASDPNQTYWAPFDPESKRAEGVLEGLEKAAQLASESAFGQNASDVIRAEIDRRKAEGQGTQTIDKQGA